MTALLGVVAAELCSHDTAPMWPHSAKPQTVLRLSVLLVSQADQGRRSVFTRLGPVSNPPVAASQASTTSGPKEAGAQGGRLPHEGGGPSRPVLVAKVCCPLCLVCLVLCIGSNLLSYHTHTLGCQKQTAWLDRFQEYRFRATQLCCWALQNSSDCMLKATLYVRVCCVGSAPSAERWNQGGRCGGGCSGTSQTGSWS